MDQEFERCLECSECKKPIKTYYSICSQSGIQRFGMCEDCPMVQKKLYGPTTAPTAHQEDSTILCCGGCGLTRDEVAMSAPLGCSLCYEVFEEPIIREISALGHLPSRLKESKHKEQLHIGRTPSSKQEHECPSTVTLVSLQKSLQETLQREDYEQAAWLRDKIQALTKNNQRATP